MSRNHLIEITCSQVYFIQISRKNVIKCSCGCIGKTLCTLVWTGLTLTRIGKIGGLL